jgi:hypothetical protein
MSSDLSRKLALPVDPIRHQHESDLDSAQASDLLNQIGPVGWGLGFSAENI